MAILRKFLIGNVAFQAALALPGPPVNPGEHCRITKVKEVVTTKYWPLWTQTRTDYTIKTAVPSTKTVISDATQVDYQTVFTPTTITSTSTATASITVFTSTETDTVTSTATSTTTITTTIATDAAVISPSPSPFKRDNRGYYPPPPPPCETIYKTDSVTVWVPTVAHKTVTKTRTVTPAAVTKTVASTGTNTATITLPSTETSIALATATNTISAVTTTTKTATTTATQTVAATATVTLVPGGPCVANPVCGPAGFNIDYYENVAGEFAYIWGTGILPPSYYITEGLKPLDSSLTNLTFYPDNDRPSGFPVAYPYADPTQAYYVGWTRSTNGGITVDANNFTLVYEGLFRAPETGAYTFCTSADDESDLFFGHGNALNCLDGTAPASATPFLTTKDQPNLGQFICQAVTLTEGLYYPVRNVVGNGMGPSAFGFTVQLPSNSSNTDDFTGYAYPLNCGSFA